MRWVVPLIALAWPTPAMADMAFPNPGIRTVSCEVEIEVPADLNGHRLFLLAHGDPPRELVPATTQRFFPVGSPRFDKGVVLSVPSAALEGVAPGDAQDQILIQRRQAYSGRSVTLRVDLHFLDVRSKTSARYRINHVSPDGIIEMTTLHVDGGWTEWLCVGTVVVGVAWFVVVFLRLCRRRPRRVSATDGPVTGERAGG